MTQSTLRRWGPWLALVVLFAIATSLLSWWQFSRREERVQKINQVIENYDKQPISFDSLPWSADADGEFQNEWRQVTLIGTYLPDQSVLVRNRPLSGQAGFLQLVPLVLEDGRILMVERGWLPAGETVTAPSSNPLPDPGLHELTVRLRVPEPDLNRDEVQGQLASVNPAGLTELLAAQGAVITDRYGRLVAESPTYSQMPVSMPKPSLDEGNHLSYAFQWLIFGIMAFIGFGWAYRNEKRLALEASGELSPRPQKANQAWQDAQFEDANQ